MKKTILKKTILPEMAHISLQASVSEDSSQFCLDQTESSASIRVALEALRINFQNISKVTLRFTKKAGDEDSLQSPESTQELSKNEDYVTRDGENVGYTREDILFGVHKYDFCIDLTGAIVAGYSFYNLILNLEGYFTFPCYFTMPQLEIEHEVDYTHTETKKIPLFEGVVASYDLPSGRAGISVRDIYDPVLDLSVSHHSSRFIPSAWHTSLDETLKEKTEPTENAETQTKYVYTDATGEEHVFEERFYTLSATGEKMLSEATASSVTADAEGRLWYENQEVFRDLRTPKGLRATTRLEDINDSEWVEQRYDEEKQAEEKLDALEEHLLSFVMMREADGFEMDEITEAMLAEPDAFEEFLANSESCLLTKDEVLSYQSLLEQKKAFDVQLASIEESAQSLLEQMGAATSFAYQEYSNALQGNSNNYESEELTVEVLDIQRRLNSSQWAKELKQSGCTPGEENSEEQNTYRASDILSAQEKNILNTRKTNYENRLRMLGLLDNEDLCNKDGLLTMGNTLLEAQEADYQKQMARIKNQINGFPTFTDAEYEDDPELGNGILTRQYASVSSQKELIEKQLTALLERDSEHREELPKRYTEYRTAKASAEALSCTIPVAFLLFDNEVKGYNQSGALVTIQPKNGKPLIVTREMYKDTTGKNLSRIHSVQDENGNAMRFYYDEENCLCRVVNSVGEEASFSYYENGCLSGIKRPNLSGLTFQYSQGVVSTVYDGKISSNFDLAEDGRVLRFDRKSYVDFVANGFVQMGFYPLKVTFLENFRFDYQSGSGYITIRIFDTLKDSWEEYLFIDNVNEATRKYLKIENETVTCWESISLNESTALLKKKQTASPFCLGLHSYSSFYSNLKTETVTNYIYNSFYECTRVASTYTAPGGARVTDTTTVTSYNEKGKPVHIQTTEERPATETGTETVITHERFFYDSADQLVKTESYTEGKEHLLGTDVVEYFYDENGRETGSASYNTLAPSDKFYTERTYDSEGRVATERDETGRFDTAFDYVGRTGSTYRVKTPNGATLAYAYDKDGKEASVTISDADGEGNTQSIFYTEGLPTLVKNGNHEFSYTYDAKGRVESIRIDETSEVTNSYTENDEDGTETKQTTYRGFNNVADVVITDKRGRVLQRNNTTYTYTPDGRLSKETVGSWGTEKTYEYDDDYRLTKYTDVQTSPMRQEVEQTITYDNKDRVTSVTEKVNDHTVESGFTYDETTGRLFEMNASTLYAVPSYDALGRETERTVWDDNTFMHGVKTSYIKHGDHATMLPSVLEFSSATDNTRLKYVYDKMGNIAKILEDGILSTRYEDATLGRLTREDNRAFAKSWLWEYDKSGNILSRREYTFTLKPTIELMEQEPAGSRIYGYEGDRLVSLNGERVIEYSYDCNCDYDCSCIRKGVPSLYRGKELVWQKPNQLSMIDGTILTYNADDLLDSISGMPIIYGRDGRILQDQHFRYLYDEKGELFGFIDIYNDGSKYAYRRDAQGNIIAILDNSGKVMVKYRYNAWGSFSSECVDNSDTANRLSFCNAFLYRGYYYCMELGLYYLKSRFYDPYIGRFISADSLGYLDPHTVGGLNLFAYCNNNPVMNVDPSGHLVITTAVLTAAIWAGALVGGLIGGAYGAMTAASLGQNVPAGIALGIFGGFLMGATAAVGSLLMAPVLSGAAASVAISVGSITTTLGAGTAFVLGAAIPFAGGTLAGAGVEAVGQLVNYGGVTTWKSVGRAAVHWGILNTWSALSSALGEASRIEQFNRYTTEISKLIVGNIKANTLVGFEGFVLDWWRGASN